MTREGTIVVDGVVASCYASVNHDLAHVGMAPLRWFPETMKLIFNEDAGFSAFMRITKEVCMLMTQFEKIY